MITPSADLNFAVAVIPRLFITRFQWSSILSASTSALGRLREGGHRGASGFAGSPGFPEIALLAPPFYFVIKGPPRPLVRSEMAPWPGLRSVPGGGRTAPKLRPRASSTRRRRICRLVGRNCQFWEFPSRARGRSHVRRAARCAYCAQCNWHAGACMQPNRAISSKCPHAS